MRNFSCDMYMYYCNYFQALGCLLYKLCFQEHPFEDSAKLRILNANYHIPPSDYTYKDFHNIISESNSYSYIFVPTISFLCFHSYNLIIPVLSFSLHAIYSLSYTLIPKCILIPILSFPNVFSFLYSHFNTLSLCAIATSYEYN